MQLDFAFDVILHAHTICMLFALHCARHEAQKKFCFYENKTTMIEPYDGVTQSRVWFDMKIMLQRSQTTVEKK